MDEIVFVAGPLTGQRTPLTVSQLTLGREANCGLILLGDPSVSRVHARMTISPQGWVLEDLRSANGTRINGLPVHAPTVLVPGVTAEIGLHGFVLQSLTPSYAVVPALPDPIPVPGLSRQYGRWNPVGLSLLVAMLVLGPCGIVLYPVIVMNGIPWLLLIGGAALTIWGAILRRKPGTPPLAFRGLGSRFVGGVMMIGVGLGWLGYEVLFPGPEKARAVDGQIPGFADPVRPLSEEEARQR